MISQAAALHILYNNAGIVGKGRDTDVANLDIDTWNQIIQVNLSGIFLCSKYAVPALIEAGGGTIINTASVAGMIGSEFRPRLCRKQRRCHRSDPGE